MAQFKIIPEWIEQLEKLEQEVKENHIQNSQAGEF